jgi:hypothetical protein
MEINYWWVGLSLLAIVILIIWIFKKDQKDKRKYKDQIIQSEIKPEKHGND